MNKMYFMNTTERLKHSTAFAITQFCTKIWSFCFFRASLCKLIFVLHKDALFHSKYFIVDLQLEVRSEMSLMKKTDVAS
jgi:hypothetical protein